MEQEDWYSPTDGFFASKIPWREGRRTELHTKHVQKALQYAIRHGDVQKALFLAGEFCLALNVLALWRELLLIAGETIGIGHTTFVPLLVGRFLKWIKKVCRAQETTAFKVDYDKAGADDTLNCMVFSVVVDMCQAPKNTLVDTLCRLPPFHTTGAVNNMDAKLPTPTIQGDSTWASDFAPHPPTAQAAARALVVGMASRDPSRVARNLFLLCVWDRTDFAWQILHEYMILTRMAEFYKGIIQDIQYLWNLFNPTSVRVTEDKTPRISMWALSRVFIMLAFMYSTLVPELPTEEPAHAEVSEATASNCTDQYVQCNSLPLEIFYMPPMRRYANIACIPEGTPFEKIVKSRLGVENLTATPPDPYREDLEFCMKSACAENPRAFGVKATILEKAKALRFGERKFQEVMQAPPSILGASADMDVPETPSTMEHVPMHNAKGLHGPSILPREPLVLPLDPAPEYEARLQSFHKLGIQTQDGVVLAKGPYSKPGLFRRYFVFQKFRSDMNIPGWRLITTNVRKETALLFDPPWNVQHTLPETEGAQGLLGQPPDIAVPIILMRWLFDLPLHKEVYLFVGGAVYLTDDNVIYKEDWFDGQFGNETATQFGRYLVTHYSVVKQVLNKWMSTWTPHARYHQEFPGADATLAKWVGMSRRELLGVFLRYVLKQKPKKKDPE